MDFEKKVYSKELLSILYESGKTLGTAESCTSGMIATAITMVPGASDYFKGGIICYCDNMKTSMLGVDYAIASTGFAGPGTAEGIPVGTIWIACGNKDEQITLKLSEDEGREKNISNAVDKALEMAFSFIQEHEPARIGDEAVELIAE